MKIKTAGLMYAGSGHWNVAMSNIGIKSLWYFESFKPAIKCFQMNWSSVKIFNSINEISGNVDIIVGSPHCNGLSNANPKNNVNHPSNNCMFEFVKIIDKIKPKYFIMEESHRLLTCNKFVELRKKILSFIYTYGYKTRCLVLDSNDYGSPQKRKRSYIIGFKYINDYKKFHLMDKEKAPSAISVLPVKNYKVNKDYRPKPRPGEKGCYSMYVNGTVRKIGETCPTITGWTFRDTRHPSGRFLAIDEIAELMGFPENYIFTGSLSNRCHCIAKGVDIRFITKLLKCF